MALPLPADARSIPAGPRGTVTGGCDAVGASSECHEIVDIAAFCAAIVGKRVEEYAWAAPLVN
jgi:hypothetical protein